MLAKQVVAGWLTVGAVCSLEGGRLEFQRRVIGERRPVRKILLVVCSLTMTLSLSKMALQP
jgi:hypothetical protein